MQEVELMYWVQHICSLLKIYSWKVLCFLVPSFLTYSWRYFSPAAHQCLWQGGCTALRERDARGPAHICMCMNHSHKHLAIFVVLIINNQEKCLTNEIIQHYQTHVAVTCHCCCSVGINQLLQVYMGQWWVDKNFNFFRMKSTEQPVWLVLINKVFISISRSSCTFWQNG